MTDDVTPGASDTPREQSPRRHFLARHWRRIVVTVAALLLLLLGANALAAHFLHANATNRGHWLIREKWELAERFDEPVDWLVVGDSSCNHGFDPEIWEQASGQTALNLCTTGSMGLLDDAWLTNVFLREHKNPKHIMVMHSYDVWERTATPSLLALIPRPWGFWEELRPRVELTPRQRRAIALSRYLPLFGRSDALADLLGNAGRDRAGQSGGFRLQPRGNMAWPRARPRIVQADARDYARALRNKKFKLSNQSRGALKRLAFLARQNDIELWIVNSPVAKALASRKAFQKYRTGVDKRLRGFAAERPHVHVVNWIPAFPAERMEAADHLVDEAAREYTAQLWKKVREMQLDPAR